MTIQADLLNGTILGRCKDVLICDIETYPNYFLIAFKRVSDGKVVTFEAVGPDATLTDEERDRLDRIVRGATVVTFNGRSFDMPIIFLAIGGATVARCKRAANQIIDGKVRYWEVEAVTGVRVPWGLDHIDLIEPQPNAIASLKTLNGRLHGKWMQDLPYPHDKHLDEAERDFVRTYCINDLDATLLLLVALLEPLSMRVAIGEQYGKDFRSHSDAQMGRAIILDRVEKVLGKKPEKAIVEAGSTFPYHPPKYIRFETEQMRSIFDRIRNTDFIVQFNGKVELPKWLEQADITMGVSKYAFGIGGLHSKERYRTVLADAEHKMFDFDVASYYPRIIITSGLYPKACGPAYTQAFSDIYDDRLGAKRRAQAIQKVDLPALKTLPAANDDQKDQIKKQYKALNAELATCKVKDSGFKIALNGGGFGSLGSPHSPLYAPHLMIYCTLTGQLALLMLIERLELAGISVVSANTDGVVVRCPIDLEDELERITVEWQRDTEFELESVEYDALYNQSVNTYIAVKPDGKVKRKGTLANPRAEGDTRTQLMNSPSMNVCADAVVAFLTKGVPLEDTIRGCRDIRDFVSIVNVRGGGKWREDYLGKVVRYIWSLDGDAIYYKEPNPTTGNYKQVGKTDGSRPMMTLPEDGEWPIDLDYDRYIAAAKKILVDIGYRPRVVEKKAPRVFKYAREAWVLASLVAI